MTAVELYDRLRAEVGKVIVGQDEAVRLCSIALVVGGHVLLEGVPGIAKTLLAKTLARVLSLQYARIQFTPDLMPADVVGTAVYDLESRSFRTRKGPVFTNILLADEINRAPAKVQSALLEAMEERGVTLEGQQMTLPAPFMVLATQNPVEYEGTYPLPEAQQDRFLFKAVLDYPTPDQELEILNRWDRGIDLRDPVQVGAEPVVNGDELKEVQKEIRGITLDTDLKRYIVTLATTTRQTNELSLGASPRAEVQLMLAAKAAAAFDGRAFVTPDDIKGLARPTFRHRLLLRPEAEVAGHSPDTVLERVVAQVLPPR